LKLNLSLSSTKDFSNILIEYRLIISSFLLLSIFVHFSFNKEILGSQFFNNPSFSSCSEFISSALAYSIDTIAHSNNAAQSQIFHFFGAFFK
jgi:hypothetical protein